jgi:hypothetical protein
VPLVGTRSLSGRGGALHDCCIFRNEGGVRLQLGIHVEPEGASYDGLLTLALIAQDTGFAVCARSDHYLPHERPGAALGPTDAWITVAGLARETSTIQLATLMSNDVRRLAAQPPDQLAVLIVSTPRKDAML